MFAKTGARGELEFAPTAGKFLQNIGAGDVHRHQVGRELNPAESERHCLGEPADEQRLRKAGHAHQQRVAAREEANGEPAR